MKKINNFYSSNIRRYTKEYLINGWGSSKSQNKRFETFLKIGNLNNKKILDIGCGTCSFYNFLNKKKINTSYTGMDNNLDMLELSKKKYNKIKLVHGNFLKKIPYKKNNFDYIFLSGALNLPEENHEKKIKILIKNLYKTAKKGLAINFLSIYAKNYHRDEFYHNPLKIMEIIFEINKKNILFHNYLEHDFTVILQK
jgi:ubiquinone/menaquinone biosynthesis C-methylase UbiE